MPAARETRSVISYDEVSKNAFISTILMLGVVEAASSSLVTQTRKREMSDLPFFFSVFTEFFRSLKKKKESLVNRSG